MSACACCGRAGVDDAMVVVVVVVGVPHWLCLACCVARVSSEGGFLGQTDRTIFALMFFSLETC